MSTIIVTKCNNYFSTPVFSEFLNPIKLQQEQYKVANTQMESQPNKLATHLPVNWVGTITFLHPPVLIRSLCMLSSVCCC